MFDSHSWIISIMNTLNRDHKVYMPEITRLLFIDDDYVNYLYFNELLEDSGYEIIRAVSISQALYKLKFEQGIKIIFISAEFAENFNFTIIGYLKDKFSSIPFITIIDDQSNEVQQRCLEEGSDFCIDRHLDTDHLIESIKDFLESSMFTNYSQH